MEAALGSWVKEILTGAPQRAMCGALARLAGQQRRCRRDRQIARAGRDGRTVPIEQKDWTEEDRASKPAPASS
jgi:hypothetical protein